MFEIKQNGAFDIDKLLDELQKNVLAKEGDGMSKMEKAIVSAAEMACLDVVAEARDQPSPGPYPPEMRGLIPPHQPNYIDWSQNLRNSIGYAVFLDGQEVRSSYSNGSEGASKAKAVANEAGRTYRDGIAAAVVAGMGYSLWVESYGYNVISTYCQNLKQKFEDYLKDAF